MKNNVRSLFNSLEERKYRRLDTDISTDLYVGIFDKKYCFVVRGNTKRINFKSSLVVDIRIEQFSISQKQLIFSLNNEKYFDIFLKFINDVIETLKQTRHSHIDVAYERWLLWKNVFSGNKEMFSEKQIRGLLAELYFMKKELANKVGICNAIYSWGGPNFHKKDFEIQDQWFEVKSSLNKNAIIKISSLSQLDSEVPGVLVVVDLERTTTVNVHSVNILCLINEIMDQIEDLTVRELFVSKLSNLNFIYDENFKEYCFEIKGLSYFKVDDFFPRLTFKNVAAEIVNCKYELDRLSLETYKIEEWWKND